MVTQSLYTGVYARGGPTNIEPSNELSALLDRSPADVRGVKFNASPGTSDAMLLKEWLRHSGAALSCANHFRTVAKCVFQSILPSLIKHCS